VSTATNRSVGRPRQFDDKAERQLIFDAAYAVLREQGPDLTIADILTTAGVSTRSFYRHFDSKDALLCAMYLRDAQWAADRLNTRLASAPTPIDAVRWWIDEIFSFTRVAKRAERVAVLGGVIGARADTADASEGVVAVSLQLLVGSLENAIVCGIADGSFVGDQPDVMSELVAAAVLHAAGLAAANRGGVRRDQAVTSRFCLRALGVATSDLDGT
jgi:AcrR family transcriptional regulator